MVVILRYRAHAWVSGWALVGWTTLLSVMHQSIIWLVGGNLLTLHLFGAQIPVLFLPILATLIYLLYTIRSQYFFAQLILAGIILLGCTMLRQIQLLYVLAQNSNEVLDRFVGQCLYSYAFTFGALMPLVIFKWHPEPALPKLLSLRSPSKPHNFSNLLFAIIAWIFVYLIGSRLLIGEWYRIEIVTHLPTLVRYFILTVFFTVIIDHLIAFGLVRQSILKVVSGPISNLEAILSVLVFSLLHYYLKPSYLVQTLFFATIYYYLFRTTGTLLYGIFLESILRLVTR